MNRNFIDPFDSLPALEREIIRLRSYESTLVIYYKDDIERSILDKIQCYDHFQKRLDADHILRSPENSKHQLKNALAAMVADGAISDAERKQIRKAIDFRNDVAHRIDHLFSDICHDRFGGRFVDDEIRSYAGIKGFDHGSVENFREILKILSRTIRTHYNIVTFSSRGYLMFGTAERALLSDIKKSRGKIKSLVEQRQSKIESLNIELQKIFKRLNIAKSEQYFDLRFDQGKMTARGQEFCYLLFDDGFSDLAVGHVFEMKLRSVRLRRRVWLRCGGVEREKPDWNDIPAVITPSRFDD